MSDTLVGVLIGARIGFVGSLIVAVGGWRTARADRRHQASLARSAWWRDRRYDTYVELVLFLRRWRDLGVRLALGNYPVDEALPAWTEDLDLSLTETRVEVSGSDAVKAEMVGWLSARVVLRGAFMDVKDATANRTLQGGEWQTVNDAAEKLDERRKAVERAVVADLREA